MHSFSLHSCVFAALFGSLEITYAKDVVEIPELARHLVIQVHSAAAVKDLPTLQALMVKDFVWSFGGDGDAEQAIAAWRSNPALLRQLKRVTALPCTTKPGLLVECPRNAKSGYRAGFKPTAEGWRMVYFVAGD